MLKKIFFIYDITCNLTKKKTNILIEDDKFKDLKF